MLAYACSNVDLANRALPNPATDDELANTSFKSLFDPWAKLH